MMAMVWVEMSPGTTVTVAVVAFQEICRGAGFVTLPTMLELPAVSVMVTDNS